MPLTLVRNDITQMAVDAIVNAANSALQQGGGVCGAIFAKSDARRLQAACNRIGSCPTGSAVITKSYGLSARHIIHAVGPVYEDGLHGEEQLLASCYRTSLELARKHRLHSIAFPLISAGIYGYPRHEALSVATRTIGDWLMNSDQDMDVYLVLFDRASFDLGSKLHQRIRAYVDENYVAEHTFARRPHNEPIFSTPTFLPDAAEENAVCPADSSDESDLSYGADDFLADSCAEAAPRPQPRYVSAPAPSLSLEEILARVSETFSQMLFRLIDERGLTDPEVYKRANLDRKLFSKIRSNPSYQPGKSTVLALAIALRLNMDQTTDLLRRAGYALSPSNRSDLIVEYFIREQIYDVHAINEALFSFEQRLLGAQ